MRQSDGRPPLRRAASILRARESLRRSDWRSWIVLGWAILVSVLYAKMVVEQRGPKLAHWVHVATNR